MQRIALKKIIKDKFKNLESGYCGYMSATYRIEISDEAEKNYLNCSYEDRKRLAFLVNSLFLNFMPECSKSAKHERAWKHFWPEGNGAAKPGYVLHHIDPTLKFRDPARYSQWNINDLMMVDSSLHGNLHSLSNDYKKRVKQIWEGKSDEYLEDLMMEKELDDLLR